MCLGTARSCKLKDILRTMPIAFWLWLETAQTHGWTQRDRASQNTFCSQNNLTVISLGSSLFDSKEGPYPKKRATATNIERTNNLCSVFAHPIQKPDEVWNYLQEGFGLLSHAQTLQRRKSHACFSIKLFLWCEITLFLSSSIRLKTLQKVFSLNFI